jgi:hypothetical protein
MPQMFVPIRSARRGRPLQWAIAMLLGAIAACLLVEVGRTTSSASAQVASERKGNIFALAGQLSKDSYGIYLVDADNDTIAIYEWVPASPSGRKLRLMAARNYSFDLKLDDYNTEPLPREIKTLVEQHRRLTSGPASQP